MRTRALVIPRPLPIFILISFALALVLGAVPVDAAPKGSKIQPTLTALTDIVSPGEDGAFLATFQNTGNPTITDLGLSVAVTAGGTLADPLPGTCNRTSATTATCLLGTQASGAAAVTHLFFATAAEPASGTTAPLTLSVTYSGDAQQNNPSASKKDTWSVTTSALVDTSAEVFGGWQDAHDPKNYPSVGSTAFQLTAVSVPSIPNGYPALVRHLDQDIDCGPGPDFEGIGFTVELRVNDGDSPLSVEMTYSATAADNTPPSQVDVLHQLDDGSCVFLVRGCAANAGHPNGCYDAFTVGTGQNKQTVVRAQLPSNGRIKGG